ncbi:hypothetical protein PRIPAC_75379 [Pristionchus pacificus]|uniref:MULE domain-containing protein n=1 Tax=Pristionchus pacificus TaxID=54126 RepID=A0A2A6B4G3_PRIPA|nr:hypothetical protein PRIPAC_75379 [Pristionchus pacificus]|eukprot:PDM60748.1 hypothetical protein PRIPAC_54554 [Pristionchus pacificus]
MSKRPVGDRFYHDGFILKKKAVLKDDRILLHCTYRESYGCRALVHQDTNGNYTVKTEHNHSPDVQTSEVVELRRELAVDAVAQPTAAPRDLVNSIRNKATSGAVVSMLDNTISGTTTALTHAIHYARPDDLDLKAVNSTFTIQGRFLLTKRETNHFNVITEERGGTQHVLPDSLATAPNLPRFVLFMSHEQLTMIGACRVLHCDGTFRIAKSLLSNNTQLWLLYARISSGEVIYAGAALMADRTQSTYERVIDVIKASLPGTWQPERIAADFEKAPRNAWKTRYLAVAMDCCYFHYAQAMRSKAKELQLDLKDIQHYTAYNRCRFMPFLPSADVPNAFVEIKQAAPPGMTAFLEYVSKNYVNGPPNGTGPRYPIDEWTVTARLGAARTNCSAEAFNSVFSKKVGPSGAKLGSRLIDLLIEEESRIATALPAFYQNPQFRIGPAECSHTRKRNEIIQRATLNVNNLTGIRYLDHLSTRIGKFRK